MRRKLDMYLYLILLTDRLNTLVWWTRSFDSVANSSIYTVLIFNNRICSSGSTGKHSVLFGNAARLNIQFDMLELNTRVFLVVITGCMDKQRRHTYTVSIHEHASPSLWWTRGFVSILCLEQWICSCLTCSFPQYSIHWFDMFWDYEIVHIWIKTTAKTTPKKTVAFLNDHSLQTQTKHELPEQV